MSRCAFHPWRGARACPLCAAADEPLSADDVTDKLRTHRRIDREWREQMRPRREESYFGSIREWEKRHGFR